MLLCVCANDEGTRKANKRAKKAKKKETEFQNEFQTFEMRNKFFVNIEPSFMLFRLFLLEMLLFFFF